MTPMTKLALAATAALAFGAATPAAAQYYDRHDRDDDRLEDALIGAAVGAVAGAVVGQGDGTYVAGGALAGAALGGLSAGGDRDDCGYYRDGRCWRNQGHWEREHGINSRDGYNRYERRQYRQSDRWDRRDHRRDNRHYRYDRRW